MPGSPEWIEQLDQQDIADFAAIHGEEIMAKAGRERDADGNWSEEDLAWLWKVGAERISASSQGNSCCPTTADWHAGRRSASRTNIR
ncbi:hypothetical protein [Mesorhizobium sp. M1406]|uniref:hypothetical protein n=1 Tax=Mesorhizobium sp. M1406 TaxID=2957099 RepID=UPI0033382985